MPPVGRALPLLEIWVNAAMHPIMMMTLPDHQQYGFFISACRKMLADMAEGQAGQPSHSLHHQLCQVALFLVVSQLKPSPWMLTRRRVLQHGHDGKHYALCGC